MNKHKIVIFILRNDLTSPLQGKKFIRGAIEIAGGVK